MHSLIVLKNLTHQLRKLRLSLSVASPSITMSSHKPLLMLVLLVSLFFVFKNPNLLLSVFQLLLSQKSQSTLKSLPKLLLTKVQFHIWLL